MFKKTLLVLLCLFSLFLLLNTNLNDIVSAEAVYDVNGVQTQDYNFDIVRLSNGTLYSIYGDETTDDIYSTFSLDNGSTWSSPVGVFTGITLTFIKSRVLSNDTVVMMILAGGGSAVYMWDIAIDSKITFKSGLSGTFYGGDIYIDENDNIHLLYHDGGTNIVYMVYRHGLNAWSDKILIDTTTVASITRDCSITSDDTYIRISYSKKVGSNYLICYGAKTISATTFGNFTIVPLGTQVPIITKIIEESTGGGLGTIYVFFNYNNAVAGKYVIECNIVSEFETFEVVNNTGYNIYLSDVQINNNHEINILYYGDGFYHTNVLLMAKTYNTNTEILSDEGYVTTGGYTIGEGYYVYQQFPDFMNVYDGYACGFRNVTNSEHLSYVSDSVFYLDEYDEGGGTGNVSDFCLILNNLNVFELTNSYRLGLQYLTPMNIIVTDFKMMLCLETGSSISASDFILEEDDYTSWGVADKLTLYYESSDGVKYYWVEWNDLNIYFNNEKPTFWIESTKSGYKFVIPTTSLSNGEQSGENWQVYNYDAHLSESNLPNTYYTHLVQNIPFCISFTQNYVPQPSPGYDDLITVPSGVLYTNKTIPISYWISSMATQNSIKIYKSDILLDSYDVYEYTGIQQYVFTSSGVYNLTLFRIGEDNVSSITVTIVDNLTENWIYCIPEPSNTGETYYIHYHYHNAGGTQGVLYLYPYDDRFYTIGFYSGVNPILLTYIDSNTTGVVSYVGNIYGVHYIVMGTYSNTSVITASYLHYIQYGFTKESVSVKYPYVYLNKAPAVTYWLSSINIQVVNWVHYRIGYTVRIYDNNLLVRDVTSQISGSSDYDVRNYGTVGTHNVSLRVITANGSIEIANTTYIVEGEVNPLPEPPNPWIPDIGGSALGYIIGFVIVLLFTIIPLGFQAMTDVAVPNMVYVLCAGIGLTFATSIGYIDIWVPFFILIIAGIIGFVLWYNGGGSGE